jgi:dihydrofolate reductase
MSIKAIFACDDDWGIGKDGGLPWSNAMDLRWFKETTLGNVCVMGRKTYESLPSPLSLRDNVVISSTLTEIPRGFLYQGTPSEVWGDIKEKFDGRKIWVVGGSQTFTAVLDDIEEIWISRISGTHECDTFLDHAAITANYTSADMEQREGLNLERYVRN